jgi:endogenous inhibitor of DNA gyrase (YacG/DUF329 family)
MPCGNFQLCHVSQSQTIFNNHNECWKSIFQKKKDFHVQTSSQCDMLDLNEWMTINDVIIYVIIWHHRCNYNEVA